MTASPSRVSVCLQDSAAFIRITGRANCQLSLDFKALMRELEKRPISCFALELGDCSFMDSTFLGVLAHFALRRSHAEPPLSPPAVSGASPKIIDLLDNLGVLSFFNVLELKAPQAEGYRDVESMAAQTSKVEMTLNCLEAHRLLMDLNPENLARFQDVAQFLAEDLERQRLEADPGAQA